MTSPYVYPGLYHARDLEGIMELVCHAAGLDRADVCSQSRSPMLVAARQAFCWFAHKYTKFSFAAMGEFIGNRDRTTAMAAIKQVKKLLDVNDKIMTDLVTEIDKLINPTNYTVNYAVNYTTTYSGQVMEE